MQVSRRIKRLGLGVGLGISTLALATAGLPYGPLDFVQVALGQVYTVTSGGGGGGGGGTTTTTTNSTAATAGATVGTTSSAFNPGAGAIIVDGPVAVTVPPLSPALLSVLSAFFGGATVTNATVNISPPPPAVVAQNISSLAGNVLAFPGGTVLEFTVTVTLSDGRTVGLPSFIAPVHFQVFPNTQDALAAAQAKAKAGNFTVRYFDTTNATAPIDTSLLNVVYFVAPDTGPQFNPLGLPVGTPVFQPNVVHNADGSLSWDTQNGAGLLQAVVANPVSYVETVNPNAQEYSSFDPNASQSFGGKPQFSTLQVVEPQIPGVNRLVVLDPDTGNYSYVNATDVAPSGPPPARSSSAVTRGNRTGVAAQSGVVSPPAKAPAPAPSQPGVVHGLLANDGVVRGLLGS